MTRLDRAALGVIAACAALVVLAAARGPAPKTISTSTPFVPSVVEARGPGAGLAIAPLDYARDEQDDLRAGGEGKPSADAIAGPDFAPRLSDYGFFADLAAEHPAARVHSYELITPLFSDYAEKHRFLYVPSGARAAYQGPGLIDLPVGAALIKTFGYRADDGQYRKIETRVLLHRADGWAAVSYAWAADGSDALLKRAGGRVPVTFTDPSGATRSISYAIPNQNQCKECHSLAGKITPIGPKVRNLNAPGQLAALVKAGLLDRVPTNAAHVARWDDASAPLADRARAYLDVNCAHCHNPAGAASNSGLFLDYDRTDAVQRGIAKHPVAAGRGSGTAHVVIDPGNPDDSILIYRLSSTEPGVAMPELGRATVHKEGVAMLRQWIAAMPRRVD